MIRAVACLLLFTLAVHATSYVTFHGGAGRVGGSCAVVSNATTCVLVDCGTGYDEETTEDPTNATARFAFDPKCISAVLLTHAHQDHSGRIPELVCAGFTGEVWMTEATRELLDILWRTQLKYETDVRRNWRWSTRLKKRYTTVHWRKDCEWFEKISSRNRQTFTGTRKELGKCITNHSTLCTTCTDLEMADLMTHVRTIPFGACLTQGVFRVTFHPTQHLPGAAAITFDDGEATWTFSGDLGSMRSRLVERIEPAERVDNLFVETTYGDDARDGKRETEAEYKRFAQQVGATVRAGGIAWIPAFALDRSQRVLVEIAKGMAEGLIDPNTPVYFPSPTARAYTQKYLAHPEWFDNDYMAKAKPLFERSRDHFDVASHTGPAIVLTTSAMMDTGLSQTLVPDLVPRTDVNLFLTGYATPNSYAGKLKRGDKTLNVNAKGRHRDVPVNCGVRIVTGFSGHGDARDNDAWLRKNKKAHLYLVHGDSSSLDARKRGLESRFSTTVDIVRPGVAYPMIHRPTAKRKK